MKNKIYTVLLIVLLTSCSEQKIEDVLTTNTDEYWAYYNPYSTDLTYFKFETNKVSQRYERDSKNKFYKYKGEGDVIEESRKWNVSKDSILIFNGLAYDIVNYNDKVIVLYFMEENHKNERMVFLTKEKESEPRKYSSLFGQKRIDKPSKYVVPNGW